ncbi:hypothetical protein H2201_000864 [Coniosporium apollinis]|uniref:DUF7896 domain-containing protein n=1 Tax=Coniosporium apollinis TaxID=61459 RepID=A0ABQ9P825_9PEZI|nr:hypothetical protein H2201_000864 [Coniosporium apollinis]
MAAFSNTDFLAQILQQERQTFWGSNSHYTEDTRQRLWNDHLASLSLSDNSMAGDVEASHVSRNSYFGGSSSSRPVSGHNVPRTMTWTPTSPGSVPMMRTPSSASTYSSGDSFSAPVINRPAALAKLNTLQSYDEEPFSAYTLASGPPVRQHNAKQPLPSLAEADVYDDPSVFVATMSQTFDGSSSLPTTFPSFDTAAAFQQDAARLHTPMSGSYSPSTMSGGELLTPSTFTSGMSRESSIAGATFVGSFEDMMRVHDLFPFDSTEDNGFTGTSETVKPSSLTDVDPSHFHSSPFGSFRDETFSSSYFSSIACASAQPFQSLTSSSEDMERSSSTQSNDSASSQPRSSRRRHELLAHGTRPIAPKVLENQTIMLRQSSDHAMMRIKSHDGSSKDVAAIPKQPYVRPTHPKVYCTMCSDYPDGFRGEHELRRHTDRLHSKIRKVWVTVDASHDGNFLKGCKQCRNGKKYGAYYNAAAHLRRAHFNPRKRGRKSKGDEKRGGKAGGDHPPMDYLKQNWMKEIEERVPNNYVDDVEDEPTEQPDTEDLVANAVEDADFSVTAPHSSAYSMLPPPDPMATYLDNSTLCTQFDTALAGTQQSDYSTIDPFVFYQLGPNLISTIDDASAFSHQHGAQSQADAMFAVNSTGSSVQEPPHFSSFLSPCF